MISTLSFKKYLLKKSYHKKGFPHKSPNKSEYDIFIVIPCYNEFHFIFNTLESIDDQNINILNKCLVIIVVNNSLNESEIVFKNNIKTFKKLIKVNYKFELIVIDFFSEKNSFNDKIKGVGTARKIGMDYVLNLARNEKSIICSLDADTTISKNYLSVIMSKFKKNNFNASVVNFQHNLTDNSLTNEAIIKYEKILKKTAASIKKTGSPYGYVSLGSTIICNLKSYIACGGMSTREATEDFYFLQSLAKYTEIKSISNILVYPSSRFENRVYLGTGFRIKEYCKHGKFNNLSFSKDSFNEIKKIIFFVESSYNISFNIFVKKIKNNLKDESIYFLFSKDVKKIWDKFHNNASTKKQFMKFFHEWFDALMIIQLLKKLNN